MLEIKKNSTMIKFEKKNALMVSSTEWSEPRESQWA